MLLQDWKLILTKAWSVRLATLSAVLSAAEYGLQYFAPEHSSASYALIAAALAFAAAIARIVAQPEMWKDDNEDQASD